RMISAWRRETRSTPRFTTERSMSGRSVESSERPTTVRISLMANSVLSPLTINRAAGTAVSLRDSSGKSRGIDGREEAGLPVDPDAGTGPDGAEGFNSRVFAVDDTEGSGAAG